tara:strand:+ start:1325 stop:1876 length:552 start_codon:yes stop_codon:yes gene_type:complete
MHNELIEKIKVQKKIPIIGKMSSSDTINTFKRLISRNFIIIEITLRSAEALETAIIIKKNFPSTIIGIGSIKTMEMLKEASKYQFDFFVSPGLNESILEYSNSKNLNFIPGISTPSEIMTAIEYEKKILKYFHAERNGGVKSLEILYEIFDNIKFIPTGGITLQNYSNYLDLPNVISVGSTKF